jgi:LysM repeat protein
MQMKLPEDGTRNDQVCPYLGLSDDPGTALAYPSTSNCCHHARPVESVRGSYQVKVCLTNGYIQCPVYLRPDLIPLPPEVQVRVSSIKRVKRRWWILLILVIVLIAVFLLTRPDLFNAAPLPTTQPDTDTQALLTITAIFASTQTATIQTPVPTQADKITPTVTMTSMPTPSPVHQLEMPIGKDPSFVIHRVQPGESYIRFMQEFQTSKEAILAVNYGVEPSLWADSLLVIPLGVTDATGLPAFTVYQVAEQNLTIEQLALNQSADLATLKQYNDLPDGYAFSEGEWVLIPH